MSKAIADAIKKIDAPVVQDVPTAQVSAPRAKAKPKAKLEPAAEQAHKNPAVHERIQDETVAEPRIKPKDDAWDLGH